MDEVNATPVEVEEAARLRAIRARLPGQMLRERIEMAGVCYGPLYTWSEVRQRVAGSLPRRMGFIRSTTVEPIESYPEHIPDEALLKYDNAVRSGFFAKFWVATPRYYEQRQVDPWIIGEVTGSEFCAVIAQW
jgi:hypothetical protein